MISILECRDYLRRNLLYIKYTVIAKELHIDKNILKDFIDGKTILKPEQRHKLIMFVEKLRT